MNNLENIIKGLTIVLFVVLMLLSGTLLSGWLLMLASGGLGHVFQVRELFIPYSGAVIASICLGIVGSFFRGN